MAEITINVKRLTGTGGLYRILDTGATVGDAFSFTDTDGTKLEIMDKIGPFIARYRKVLPGSDMTSLLQTILNTSEVKEVVLDNGDITVNGTLTVPAGKKLVFTNSGAVTGTGTITGNGTFTADIKDHVFKGTVLVRIKPDLGEWSVKWFGATGNGSTDDQPTIQRCVDAGVAVGTHRWYFPAGTYVTGKGILFRKDNGSGEPLFFMNAIIRGEGKAYGATDPATHTRIIVAANSFGFGIDRGKGVIVIGIGFEGQNYAPYSVGSDLRQLESDSTVWVSAGVRDDSYSPHAGIVIDPFSNASTPSGKIYPGFEAYYVNTAAGGSTDIKVAQCYARQCVVGFAITPHNTPQNGDHIEVCDTWSEYNKVSFSLGQSQNRTIAFNRVACWGGTETVFDCRRYGDGTSGVCEATNVNIAGGVKYLCRIPGFDQNNGLTIRDCHAESLWAIGGSIGDGSSERSGHLKIINSFINLYGPDSYGIYGCKTIYKGKSLVMENSSILNLQGTAFRVHNIDVLSFSARDCSFEAMYTFGTSPTQYSGFIFQNCTIMQQPATTNYYFNAGFYYAETSDKFTQVLGDVGFEEQLIQNNWPSRVYKKKPRQRSSGARDVQPGYQALSLGQVLFTAVDYNSRTATMQMTPNGNLVKMMYTDLVLVAAGFNQFGDIVIVDMGHVNTVNISTGVVTVKHLNTWRPVDGQLAAGNSYDLAIMRVPRIIHADVLGDVTAGSAVVPNVDTNTNGYFYPPLDTYVDSPYFPPFTRIIGYDRATRTMTLSHPATATKTNVPFCDVWLTREMYFSEPPMQIVGWREGDIVYNNGSNPAYDNVLSWVCTKHGMQGAVQGDGSTSSRIAEWKPVYKVESGGPINDTLTSDDTVVIPDGKFCSYILVKPSANLAGFKIGTTNGGDEVISTQAISGGSYIPFEINKLADGAPLTLYLGGITSSIEIKIYYV